MHRLLLLLVLSVLAISPLVAGPTAASQHVLIVEYPLLPDVRAPRFITVGPDGNLWLTAGPDIVRVTPEGAVTLRVSFGGLATHGIAAGPDGNIWFSVAFPLGPTAWIGRMVMQIAFCKKRVSCNGQLS
jgi:hypothetical protein